jgi:hypothetical protein
MIYRPVRYAGDIIIGRESGGVFGGSISSSSVRSVIGCASRFEWREFSTWNFVLLNKK